MKRILVVGDLILDQYVYGTASRISPEAPVPVIAKDRTETRLGGAASVCNLVAGLEAIPVPMGIVGLDAEGWTLCETSNQFASLAAVVSCERMTTTKTRVVGNSCHKGGQQVVRVDSEDARPICSSIEDELLGLLGSAGRFDAILISDYGKGVCTERVLREVIALGLREAVPVLVDPARGTPWEHYRGATVLKCNAEEASSVFPVASLGAAAAALSVAHDTTVCVTDGPRGAFLATRGTRRTDDVVHYPCRRRDVSDVTGCGDTVLATLGVALASCLSMDEGLRLAMIAGGIQSEKQGVERVTLAEIRRESPLVDLLATA